jgi:DNA polymerase-1
MPSTLRSTIVAEEGYTLLSLDASQIELRVLAILSQDPAMLEDLKSKDLHMATAVRMFGHTDDEAEMKKRRYKAKQGNFADVYGADEYKLSEMLECSIEEARSLMQERKRSYPLLYKWMADTRKQAKEDGYVKNIFGRIRPIPELYSSSWKEREKAEREVINTLGQGTAVDIVKMMGLYLRSIFDNAVRCLLQVHDEWVWEVPNALLQSTIELCNELKFAFPDYPCVVSVGLNYGGMEKI